jgi:hypothetical protein
MIPHSILIALSRGQQIEAFLASEYERIAWVSIIQLFPNKVPGIKFGQAIKPNAKYVVKWLEMTQSLYQAYLQGEDVTANDAEKVERELADNEDELYDILSQKLHSMELLLPRSQNRTRLP